MCGSSERLGRSDKQSVSTTGRLVTMVTTWLLWLLVTTSIFKQVPTPLHAVHVEETSATAVFLCRMVMMGSKETIVTTQKQK